MILRTKDFQEAASKILLAVDKSNANLELAAQGTDLFLRVTNREIYAAVRFALSETSDFRAVVDANLFLNLISGINTDEFELKLDTNCLHVKAGKSKYKLALIFENDSLLKLPVIKLEPEQVNVSMTVSQDVLSSILNVNAREVQKAKRVDVNELQKYFYLTADGCFTFTNGACINNFTLEKPITLLLTERLVRLFKLFNSDTYLSYGHIPNVDGSLQAIVTMQTADVYIAARLLSDETCIQRVKAPCDAMKALANEVYAHSLVVSAVDMSAAVARLLMFYKNSTVDASRAFVPATITFTDTDLMITDASGENTEVVTIENGSNTVGGYAMGIDLLDLKAVLDSCKNEHITMNCGNHRSVILTRGSICNVIAETRTKE